MKCIRFAYDTNKGTLTKPYEITNVVLRFITRKNLEKPKES